MTPVSFDVVSLYTNIYVEEAINTSLDYTHKYYLELHGLTMENLWELLRLILDYNVFQYGKMFFKQIRGLAMGNRLSGTLAIICMDRLECLYIYEELKPTIYARI